MAKIQLSISKDYVSNWGLWEAIREINQNGKDEEEARGNQLVVEYRKGWLYVANIGANLTAKSLILGEGDKAGKGLRGEKCEGLALSFLAAVRSGHNMILRTKNEVWRCCIEYNKDMDSELLTFHTRKRHEGYGIGVEVFLKLNESDWCNLKSRLLFLNEFEDGKVVETKRGKIILHHDYAGLIYSKGIFVHTNSDLKYGYDLYYATLDRDRNFISQFDFNWEVGAIFNEAVSKGALDASVVYDLAKNDLPDVTGMFEYSTTDELKKKIAEQFDIEHKGEAVPVRSMAQCKELEHVGMKGIVASKVITNVVEDIKGRIDERVNKLRGKIVKQYSWSDLEEVEKDNLQLCSDILAAVIGKDILEYLQVVDFNSDRTEAQAKLDSKQIMIAKRILLNRSECMVALVHEYAHIASLQADGTFDHVGEIENLWKKIFEHLLKQKESIFIN